MVSNFSVTRNSLREFYTLDWFPHVCALCEWEGDVVAVDAPPGGVAQVVSHGVKVVGVHEEEGKEKDEEVRVEVKGEVGKLREKRSSWMAWRWNDGLKDDLSQCGVTRVINTNTRDS